MELKNTKNALAGGYLLHWYEIRQIIGRGGFGITYLAQDNNLDRLVAIKEFMPEDFAMRESDSTVHPKSGEQKELYEWGLRRFVDEARTLAKFTHPNIVRVLSVFEANNTAYMIMEYAQGRDLSGIYKKSPKMSEDALLDIFIPIMDGLSLVHNAGFIHRDIKPANIYICDHNTPLLLDFGSARQSLGGKTKALTSLVTFGYAPFEQYNEGSGKQGCWTDIYSLGASIYTGITGKKPVDAMARGGSLLDQNIDAYEPVSIIAKGEYSDNFLLAVDKALMFKVEDRPTHILQCADMLLGKIQAPELPDFMMRQPSVATDKAVINSGANYDDTASQRSSNAASVSSRSQGLIDARGVRHSGRTDTVIRGRDTGRRLNSDRVNASRVNAVRAGEEQSRKKPQSDELNSNVALKKAKPRGSIIAAVLVTLILAATVGWFLNKDIIFEKINTLPGLVQMPAEPLKADRKQKKSGRKKQQQAQIKKLLVQASTSLKKADYVTPPLNNARRYYQKVLKLDGTNETAKQGLKNIENELLRLARAAQSDKQYELSHLYLRQIKTVNPDSISAESLHKTLDSDLNKSREVTRWLVAAQKHIKNNRYTGAGNNNAYSTYRKILQQQPANTPALKGIKNIQNHYISLFNRHLAASHFKRAKQDIKVMKSIGVALADISAMQKKLASKQQRLAVKASSHQPEGISGDISGGIKSPATQPRSAEPQVEKQAFKKLNIEQVSHKVTQFKIAIQSRNTTEIKKISQFIPGRLQFVEELLSQYQNINVKISGLQLIASKNSARAQVELKDLVDIKGKKIIPGNWSRFAINISYNNKNELKVYW